MENKKICSWCGRVISKGKPPISHGICPACRDEHFPDKKEKEMDDDNLLELILMRSVIVIKKEE